MRRLISAFFYSAAGLFLLSFVMVAFIAQGEMSRWEPMAVMAGFALAPLAIGVLVSPGSRVREMGIVLLAVGVLSGLSGAMIAMVMRSAHFRAALPPESRKAFDQFGDPWLGIGIAGAMFLLGLLMVLRGPYRPPRA